MDTETGQNESHYNELADEASTLLIQENPNPEDDDNLLGDIPPWSPTEIAVTSVAGVTVAIAIGTLLLSSNPIVLVIGILGLLIPPYTAFQEQKMRDCAAMEETSETMENELGNLKKQNERLAVENKKLGTSVAKLGELQTTFEEISAMGEVAMDDLEEQLKGSKKILEDLQKNSLAVVLGNVLDIILSSDLNDDAELSDKEIDFLIKKLEGINNIEIDDERMKKLIIDGGRDIAAVCELCQNIMDNDPNTGPVNSDEFFEKTITFL